MFSSMTKGVDENKKIPDLWPSVILLKWPVGVWKCCSVPRGEDRGLHAVWTQQRCIHSWERESTTQTLPMGKDRLLGNQSSSRNSSIQN